MSLIFPLRSLFSVGPWRSGFLDHTGSTLPVPLGRYLQGGYVIRDVSCDPIRHGDVLVRPETEVPRM